MTPVTSQAAQGAPAVIDSASLTRSIQVEQLTCAIGAELGNVNLGVASRDKDLANEIRQLLLKHKVLFFRDQDITRAEHVAFARHFGELEDHPVNGSDPANPGLVRIYKSVDAPNDRYENSWHCDSTWREKPPFGSVLRCVECPPVGGDTMWANMALAYEKLPEVIKKQIAPLRARHSIEASFGAAMPIEKRLALKAQYPDPEHPVVRTHPETGEKILFVSAFATHFTNFHTAENVRYGQDHAPGSSQLLQYLISQAFIPEYQVRFRWKPNSVAMWDNRCTQHYAVMDYPPCNRKMERAGIIGDAAYEGDIQMSLHNKQWLLMSRVTGEPTTENFKLVEVEVPDLQDGEVLVRHHYLSLDPYMRGRMTDAKNYATLQPLNEVMIGGTVGEVAASKNTAFAVGDPVVGMGGWQLYQRVAAAQLGGLRKVDTNRIPLSAYLGAVGMPGVTAWYGLNRIIEPKAGQTVVVSAASGAVGGTVGQLAKVRGARAVGIAGGPDKCRYVTQELGFDACIDYKQHQDLKSLSQALKEACPDGIDGHFENVGGMILDAVLLHSNSFARVALCGMISRYGQPIPITQTQHILMNRMRLEAFVISEHMEVWPDALKELGTLVATGKLKYRETVSQGLETAPEALFGLFKGRNFGKQLVKLV